MKAKAITAKIRDAVPVCFIVNGEELQRYKNIEIPDSLKELELKDFHFQVSPTDEKIAFHLIFDEGVLPKVFPESKPLMKRDKKAADEVMSSIATECGIPEVTEAYKILDEDEKPEDPAITEEITSTDEAAVIANETDEPTEPQNLETVTMEVNFNVTSKERRALVTAIEEITGEEAQYKGVPSFAFEVSGYMITKDGTLIGNDNQELLSALAERGFNAA
jgi:hypothetical protein